MIAKSGYLKIIDFGNSFVDYDKKFSGTLEYMSPEVLT